MVSTGKMVSYDYAQFVCCNKYRGIINCGDPLNLMRNLIITTLICSQMYVSTELIWASSCLMYNFGKWVWQRDKFITRSTRADFTTFNYIKVGKEIE